MPAPCCWCGRKGCSALRFLRSILSALFFAMFGMGGILFSVALLFPFPPPRARRLLKASFRFFVWAGRVTGLFRVEISPEDRRRLAAVQGSVVVANHLSLIDAVILTALLGDSVCITKEAVSRNPFMRAVARNILIVRDNPIGVLESSREHLSRRVNVVVFPEGTRTPADAPRHRFRRGAARIALNAGAPIETVAISCDPPVLGKGQPWWDVGTRTVVYWIRCCGRIETGAARLSPTDLTAQMHERIFAS